VVQRSQGIPHFNHEVNSNPALVQPALKVVSADNIIQTFCQCVNFVAQPLRTRFVEQTFNHCPSVSKWEEKTQISQTKVCDNRDKAETSAHNL
jgi:hypothetical protein